VGAFILGWERLKNKLPLVTFYAAAALFVYTVLNNAWVADDAFISMRHAQNLVLGNGLTFNPGERVQGFTNPLWTLVLAGARVFTEDLLLFSFAAAGLIAIALVLLLRRYSTSLYAGAGVLLFMSISKAFVEYSSSGLENALAHLLICCFVLTACAKHSLPKLGSGSLRRYTLLSVLAGLVIVNRFDHALLVLPLWCFETVQLGWRKAWKPALIGFSPLIAWCVFAVVYYGFLFPNTYYAKLSAGFDSAWYWERGLHYLRNSLDWDPITLVMILSVTLWAWLARSKRESVLMLGAVLYVLYVVKIGGDFMSGRFFSTPFILALLVGAQLVVHQVKSAREAALGGMIPLLLVGFIVAPFNPVIRPLYNEKRPPIPNYEPAVATADEALYYCPMTCLMNKQFHESFWKRDRERAYVENLSPLEMPVVLTGGVGMVSYYNPQTRFVDVFALGDALLARLPHDFALQERDFRIGHIGRKVPAGYYATLATGKNEIASPCIRPLYDDLRAVIAGPLFTVERFAAWKRLTIDNRNYVDACRDPMGFMGYEHGWQ